MEQPLGLGILSPFRALSTSRISLCLQLTSSKRIDLSKQWQTQPCEYGGAKLKKKNRGAKLKINK